MNLTNFATSVRYNQQTSSKMYFATNALGLPIFITNPSDGTWVCLHNNVADGTIVQPDGTVVPVNVDGNPDNGAAPPAAIAQPAFTILISTWWTMWSQLESTMVASMGQ